MAHHGALLSYRGSHQCGKNGKTPERFLLGMKFLLTMRRKYEKYGNHKSPGAIAGHL
jgi:hypothetical protein